MKKINHKTVMLKNPETKKFESLPAIKGDSGVSFQENQPTDDSKVWIKPKRDTIYILPEINDEEINKADTWSSNKISTEFDKKANNENWEFLGSQDFVSGENINLTVDFEGVKYKKIWIVIAYTSFSASSQVITLNVGGEARQFTYSHTSKAMYRFLLEDKIEANEVNRKSNIMMERSLIGANVYATQQGLPLIEDLESIQIYTSTSLTLTNDTAVYVYGLEA